MTDDLLHGLGCVPSPFDPKDQQYHFATLGVEVAPTLPVQTLLPPWHPLNQNGHGTCTGESVLLATVVAYHKKTGVWLYANEAEAQSAAETLYVEATGDHTMLRGSDLRTILKWAQATGIRLPNGSRVKIASYHTLLPAADQPTVAAVTASIEAAIAAGMVVITGWYWPQIWMTDPGQFATYPSPVAHAPLAGCHAIAEWRAAMGHPSPGATTLLRMHAFEQSWNGFGNKGTVYFDSGLESRGWMFDAWVAQC